MTDAAKDSNNPNMIATSIKTYLDGEMFKQVGLDHAEAIAIAQKDPSLRGSVAFMVVATTIQVTKLKKVSSDAIPSEHLVLDGKLSLSLEQIKDGLLAGGNKKVVEEDESAPYAAEEKKQKSFGARFVRFITGITNFFLNGLKGLKNLFTFSSKKKDDTKPAQEAVKPVATVVTDQKTGYIMSVFKSLGSKLHIISTPVVETEVQQPAPVEKTKTASQQPALDMQDEVRLTMNNSF